MERFPRRRRRRRRRCSARARCLLCALAFFAACFLAGASIPYACHVHNVPESRLDALEEALRNEAELRGRTEDEIETLVRELRKHYGRHGEGTDGQPQP